MPKMSVLLLIVTLLLLVVAPEPAAAFQSGSQVPTVEGVKGKVARLGTGAKAKATIRLKNGTKVKGYVAQAGDEEFVMADRKTDAQTRIRYEDVLKVEENRGHSTARNVGLGVAAGVGAVLAVIFITIAHLD